jgi:hypothetical protein
MFFPLPISLPRNTCFSIAPLIQGQNKYMLDKVTEQYSPSAEICASFNESGGKSCLVVSSCI